LYKQIWKDIKHDLSAREVPSLSQHNIFYNLPKKEELNKSKNLMNLLLSYKLKFKFLFKELF
jgi:hypothetical protein